MLTRRTKTLLVLLAILSASGLSLYAQRTCDTLVCHDGRRIPAQILRSKEGIIYYFNCDDFVKSEFSIARGEVQSYIPGIPKNEGLLKSSVLEQQHDAKWHSRNSIIVMAGINLSDFQNSGYYELEYLSPFQYGLQLHAKNSPLQLLLAMRPYLYHENETDIFRSTGLNAEFTFTIKKISIGRFTGRLNKGYWGVEAQYGRRDYYYKIQNPVFSPDENWVKSNTWAILARFGLQHTEGPFYWDLAFSAGYRKVLRELEGSFFAPFENENILTIQPLLNVGIRF